MSSMVLDGATPRSRSTDSTTSVDAGRAAKLHASQVAVLEAFELMGEMTQADVEVVLQTSWSPSRLRSAVSELVNLGRLEPTGDTRITRYGRRAGVYRLVSD